MGVPLSSIEIIGIFMKQVFGKKISYIRKISTFAVIFFAAFFIFGITSVNADTPPTVVITVSPGDVPSGSASTLTWTSTDATSCTASGDWSGVKATSGSESTGNLTSGKSYTITCTGAGGTATAFTFVTVSAAPPPPSNTSPVGNLDGNAGTACNIIGGWTVDMDTPSFGTPVHLYYDTPSVPSMPMTFLQEVYPNTDRPDVNSALPGVTGIHGFTIDMPSILKDGVTHRVYAFGIDSAPGHPMNMQLSASPMSITCASPISSAPPTVVITTSPGNVTSGSASTLTWTSTNATSCTASGDWSGAKATPGDNISTSESTGNLTSGKSYTIACTGAGGTATAFTFVTVSAVPPPTATITISDSHTPPPVVSGSVITVRWTSTNTNFCQVHRGDATNIGPIAWEGTTGAVNTPITEYTRFRVMCQGSGSPDAFDQVSIDVTSVPTPPTVVITVSPGDVPSGSASTLTWTSTDATSCTASGDWSGVKATSGSESTGNLTSGKSYTITCTGAGGTATAFTFVTVSGVPPTPPTVVITASPGTVISGNPSTLTWTSTDATTCTADGDWSGSKTVSGTESTGILTTGSTATVKTYGISCTGLGGTANATTAVTVNPIVTPAPRADISVSKTSNKSTANEGDTVTYTIFLVNNGPDDATGVMATDILHAGLNLVSATPSLGSYATSTGIWTVDSLVNGSTTSMTVVVTIRSGYQGQTIPNTATTTADQTDPTPGNNTSTVNVTVNTITASGRITFCIILADENNVIATSSSSLPAGVFSINLNTATTSGSNIQSKTWTTGAFNPNRRIIVNSGFDADCVTYDNLAVGTYYYSQLDVTGSLWVTPQYNDQKTQSVNNVFDFFLYDSALFNTNPSDDAGRNLNSDGQIVLVAGNLDQTLVILQKDDHGLSCPAPQITSALTASGTVGQAFSYLFTATSATTTLSYSATGLPPGLTFNSTTRTISGTPTASGTFNVSLNALNQCVGGLDSKILVVTVAPAGGGGGGSSPSANMGIVKTANKTTASVGDTVTYTVTVSNSGPDNATGVTATDTFPSDLNLVSVTISVGSFATSTKVWTIGNLNNGSSATMTIVATVKTGTEGHTVTNSINVSATEPDPVSTNNTSSINVVVNGPVTCPGGCPGVGGGGGGGFYNPYSDLVVTKTSNKSTANVGDTLVYIISVTNRGPQDANQVVITDPIPDGFNFLSYTSGVGTTYSTVSGNWTIGDLKVGSSTTLVINGTVKAGYQGHTIVNTAVAYSAQADPLPENNTVKVSVPILGGSVTTGNGSCYYLYDYLRRDFNNNPVEVRKLQVFLRDLEGFSTVQITGIYDDQTIVALNAFQDRYKADILTPWGHNAPTGYTYILTKKKVNEIYCRLAFPVSAQQQTEIDAFRNFLQGLQNAGIILPGGTVTPGIITPGTVIPGTNSTTTPEFPNDVIGFATTSVATTTPGIMSRLTANVIYAWNGVFGSIDWCGWINLILLLIIGALSYLWYREWDHGRKIENLNKEIDLTK